MNLRIAPWIESAKEWIILHRGGSYWLFRWGFDPISRWLFDLVQWTLYFLHFMTWPGVLALVFVVALRVSGVRSAVTAGVAVFVIGTLIVLAGVDPITIVEYSIVFAVVILPFTYLPLLLVASDERLMGRHVNGPLAKGLGWLYLAIVTVAALAAIPLLIMTHGGQG